jgi:hypothetical protein
VSPQIAAIRMNFGLPVDLTAVKRMRAKPVTDAICVQSAGQPTSGTTKSTMPWPTQLPSAPRSAVADPCATFTASPTCTGEGVTPPPQVVPAQHWEGRYWINSVAVLGAVVRDEKQAASTGRTLI